ncbi:MAG: hypothetical protein U5K55_05510 [Aliarcobacter sp.]|nr:hypothetical protein [Aliarcobacter sp.]
MKKTKQLLQTNSDSLQTNNSFYELNFDEKQNVSTFKIDIKEDGKYLFFTEHMPTEFEDK